MPLVRGPHERQAEGDDRFLDEGDGPRSSPGSGEHEADSEDDFEDAVDEALSEGEESSEEDEALDEPPRRRRAPDEREAELARLRAENEALRRTQPPPQPSSPQEEDEHTFERRIAQMEPYEQLAERQRRSERRYNNSLAYIQASTADQLDKAAFMARLGSDKRFSKYADEVERRHQQLLMGGPNQSPQLVPRETILKVLLGEKIMAPATREQRRVQERQQRKLDNQRVRPGSSRGDVRNTQDRRGGPGDEREARRQRLANVEI